MIFSKQVRVNQISSWEAVASHHSSLRPECCHRIGNCSFYCLETNRKQGDEYCTPSFACDHRYMR